jgi:aspartyl-tRNA(Asn)/glutamyl-tRNA(Gln) amidotransferase subunit A
MSPTHDISLGHLAEALRRRDLSAEELSREAVARHSATGTVYHAYKHFDPDAAMAAARRADRRFADGTAGPLCGLPVSVKDLYGVEGMPTFAGTPRQLPDDWSRDAWLVARLRKQGAVFVGKTHTVEMAYGGVGINPHWGTPRNPWDAREPRIPGGSSCGAGVSLWEGSAMVALGTDTGGSIRIPASMTGVVGHKTTKGRWPTDGVVPLSSTLDTVGALTRTVADSIYFFGAVDPAWGDPHALMAECARLVEGGLRVAVPDSAVWRECQTDIAGVLRDALDRMRTAGWRLLPGDGHLLDAAEALYMHGGLPGAECSAFLWSGLPGWMDILHPTVAKRLAGAPALGSERYRGTVAGRQEMLPRVPKLFEGCDVLALPTAIATPATVEECGDLERYIAVNATTLKPTCAVGWLGLCSVTLPVGLDAAGMPVGLQLVAPGGRDELALAAAWAVERTLGPSSETLGELP